MAKYRGDDGSGRRTGLIVLLLALLFAGGLFFWRTHQSAPVPVQSASETAAPERSRSPQTAANIPAEPRAHNCTAPGPGAAGVFELHFDFDKSDIRDSDRHWLEDAANAYSEIERQLAECTSRNQVIVRLGVVGHADTAGPRDYNQSLSERRAAEVTRGLVRHGVPESQIRASGVGEDDLAVETPDNTPNAANRRAGITITIEVVAPNS